MTVSDSDHDGDRARAGVVTRMFAKLAQFIAALLLLMLVLVALYVGIGRLTMAFVSQYRGDIETLVAEKLGQSVALGEVSGDWQWLDPVLVVRDLTLITPDEPDQQAGEIGSLLIRLDSVASLLRGRLVFRDLLVDDVDITVVQQSDGTFSLQDIPLASGSLLEGDAEASLWPSAVSDVLGRIGAALSDPFIRLSNVRLRLTVPDDDVRIFLIPHVDLAYAEGRLQASGRALQPESEMPLARFHLEGDHIVEGRFSGRLFLDVDSPRLFDTLLKRYDWQQKTITALDFKGQGWLQFSNGQLMSVNARVALPYLQFDAQGETQAPLEAIEANLGWRRTSGLTSIDKAATAAANGQAVNGPNWSLVVTDLSWQRQDNVVSPMTFRVSREANWDLKGENLAIAPLTQLMVAILPMDAETRRTLAGSQPSGLIEALHLRIPEPADDFDLTARFTDVAVQAHDGAPAAANVAGQLEMDATSGRVTVDAPDITVGFPELFNGAWTFDRLATEVRWQLNDNTTRVQADQITMDYQQETHFSGAFELILEDPGNDTLSLRVGVENANAGMLADFIPAKEVDDELYAWLTTAIESAVIEEGWYFGHGPVNENSPDGTFNSAMRYRFSDGRVRYDENWPTITDIAGDVVVEGSQARIALTQGRTGGLALKPSTVTVDGDAEPAVVTIDTAASITGEQVGQWLRSTPLSGQVGDAGQALTLSGDYDLDLNIRLPLDEDAVPVLDIAVDTDRSQIRYGDSDSPVVWEEVTGNIRFQSSAGFSGDPVTARFMGEPVTVSFAQSETGDMFSVTQSGRVIINRMLEQLKMPAIPGVSGRANYQAQLRFSGSQPAALQVQSSMANLAVDWPEPIGKTVGQGADFELNVGWSEPGAMRVYGHWRDRVAYNLQWRDAGFERGALALGATTIALPETSGLDVTGAIASLDLAAWQRALEGPLPGFESLGNDTADNAGLLNRVQLSIGELNYADHRLNDMQVTAEPQQEGWSVRLDGPGATGTIQLPAADAPIEVNLQHLALAMPVDSRKSPNNDEDLSFDEAGVKNWPDIDFSVDSLRLNDRPFGAWSLLFRPREDALRIEKIKGDVGSLTLDGHLRWQKRVTGEQTQFKGELSGENLADISPLIDGTVPLRSGKTEVQFDLAWDGSPQAASLSKTAGLISYRLDDGALLESNNAAQIFRVFGILNSDTLMRRLRLDFSDIYEAGVAFDAISGTARLGEGTLTWDPEMQIVGPSGAFRLSGSTNMVSETLDMRMVVVLPLTQNLPLAAILMGASAPIGGALFVLDKVLGDPLSKLTSATYRVGGTWDEPDVDLQNVFDTGS